MLHRTRVVALTCLLIFSTQGRAAEDTVEKLFQILAKYNCSSLLSAEPDIVDLLGRLTKLKAQILVNYPPEKFQIIGVGQSPSILIAALQASTNNYAFNLPLSSFRALIEIKGSEINSALRPAARRISKEELKVLGRHFSNYIPASKKQLILVDFSSTGATLLSVYYYLKAFLEENEINRQISILTLTGKSQKRSVVINMMRDLERLGYFAQTDSLRSYAVSGSLGKVISNTNDQLTISEYGTFDIAHPEASLEASVHYKSMVQWLRGNE